MIRRSVSLVLLAFTLSAASGHALPVRPPAPLRASTPIVPRPEAVSPPQPGDYLWNGPFGLPSADGDLSCAVRFGNDLIVGGSFSQIGGIAANDIARWDGAAWHSLGDVEFSREVTCLAVYRGALYAGGPFQYVNGSFTAHLAKWNGAAWSPVGAFTGAYYCCYDIRSLTVYRDELIAAGSFPAWEDPRTQGIRRYDGSVWGPLGEGVNGTVSTTLVVGDSLFVAGAFDTAGGAPANRIALWDGTAWSALGGGIQTLPWGSIRSMAWYQDRLFVAGVFDSIGGQPSTGLAVWDGAAWSTPQGFPGSYASAVAVHDGALMVAADAGIVEWDGSNWIWGPTGVLGAPSLLSDPSGLIAVGGVFVDDTSGGLPIFGIARWDGTGWRSYEPWNSPMRGLATYFGGPANVARLASYRGHLVAAGYIEYSGSPDGWHPTGPVVAWDGSAWTTLGTGLENTLVTGAYADADTLFATGLFYRYDETGLSWWPAARLDADHWTPLDTLTAKGTCMSRYQGDLLLGTGTAGYPPSAPAGVYRWNGAHWDPFAIVSGTSPEIHALCVAGAKLIVAGRFTSIEGVQANGIATWDGVSWRAYGSSGPGYDYTPEIAAVALQRGTLLAAGRFSIGGDQVPLASWDGSTWTAFPGIRGSASSMRVFGDRILVGGDLSLGDSSDRIHVALWDGRQWSTMGSGLNAAPLDFLEQDGALYVGGPFSSAGGMSSFGIARWSGLAPTTPAPPIWLSAGAPNPFKTSSLWSFRIEHDGPVRVAVYDVQGREVALLENGFRSTGTYPVSWQGRDRDGKPVPAGVYFLSVRTADGTVLSRKTVRLR